MNRFLFRFVAAAVILGFTIDSTYADLVDGLVSYWNFDQSTGTVLTDEAGGNDGMLFGPNWVSGKFGNALSFAGNGERVELPQFGVSGNQVSVGGWVRLNTLPTQTGPQFTGIFDSQEDSFVLYTDQQNAELRFKVTTSGAAERPGIQQSTLSTSDWFHVLGVYDGSQNRARIYQNGVLQDEHALSGNLLSPQLAWFGSQPGAAYHLDGAIDDFAVWDRALTAAEIGQLQQASIGQLVAVPEANTILCLWVVTTGIAARRQRGRPAC